MYRPPGKFAIGTAKPTDNYHDRWPNMAFRNERTAIYYNEVVKPAIAAQFALGRPISPADPFLALDPATELIDGVHPNDSGKAKINLVWFETILETGLSQ